MFPSRGRTIAVLLLTALVLVTADSRSNAAFDTARRGFATISRPFVVAADVATRPVRDIWAATTEVDDLRAENAELRSRLDGSTADLIAAENAIIQANELKEPLDLDSLGAIPKVAGNIVGDSPSNFEQRVELGIGSEQGVRVGMPVISGGLIGKITSPVGAKSSEVMLVTDPEYFVRVKIVSSPESGATTVPPTTPSGLPVDGLDDAVAASTTTTEANSSDTIVPAATGPTASSDPKSSTPDPESTDPETDDPKSTDPESEDPESTDPSADGTKTDDSTAESATTSTEPQYRDTGTLHGNGAERLPSITFISNSRQFSQIEVGDLVLTTGGTKSLAPEDIPVGRVANIIEDNGVDGAQIEVELTSDLDKLNFLTVLLYQPQTELSAG